MNCQDIARILDEREVDSLLVGEQSDVQAHLVTCRDCARDWEIHAQLSNARIPEVPAGLRMQYPQRTGEESSGRRPSRFVVIGAFIAVAAAAAGLVLQMNSSHAPDAAVVSPPQADPVVKEPSVMEVVSEFLYRPTESGSEDNSKAEEEWIQRVAEWLAVRDDPDALITAAMLLKTPKPDAGRIQSLLQRATAIAPHSERINALAMLLCQALKPCDTTPYEQALRRAAPDNALGWSGDVYRASEAGDQEALRSALAAMARTKKFDIYFNPSIAAAVLQISAALVAPLDINGGNSPGFNHAVAVGAIAALPIPAYGPITRFCKAATDEGALLECRQIGAAMAAGDTVLANLLGLTVSASGLPAASAEARSLEQQKRQIRWINSQGGITADDPLFPVSVATHPREIDTLRAFLEERGIPTEPPTDWKR